MIKKSLFQINLCVLLLGGTALFAKLISLPAGEITFFRSIFGGVALVVVILTTNASFRLQLWKDYFFVILTGLLTGGHWIMYFHSIQISTVAVGILSLYTFPVMTTLMEPLFERERISLGSILRAVIVFIGIFLIIPKFEISNQMTSGIQWGLLSAMLFSVRNITVRKRLGHLSSITVMLYQLVIVVLMLLPFISFQHQLTIDNR